MKIIFSYSLIISIFVGQQKCSASISLGTCNLQCSGQSSGSTGVSGSPLNDVQGPPGKKGPKGIKGEPGNGCDCDDRTNSFPTSCSDLNPNYGVDASGIYVIQPFDNSTRIPVYCDLHTDGGGWMIFQRRLDGSEDFYRNFSDYVRGFGKLTGEFWLGLNVLHELTKNGDYELRIDMADFENQTRYAVYRNFTIGSGTNYTLTVTEYQGTAGNGIQSPARFSARDFDQDTHRTVSCSQRFKGGWWYSACHSANPNGLYLRGNHTSYANGVNWRGFRGLYYSLKTIEMKLRKKRI